MLVSGRVPEFLGDSFCLGPPRQVLVNQATNVNYTEQQESCPALSAPRVWMDGGV